MPDHASSLPSPADGGDKSHTRWIVSLTAAAALLYRRDILMLHLLVGAIGSAIVCKILKRVINKARPASSSLSDPGMPSSHAQALFFFSTYLSWLGHDKLEPPGATLVPSALSLAALLLTARRVQRGHHDVAQVSVGALLGIVNSTLWYRYSHLILSSPDSDPIPTPVIIGIMLIGAAAVGSLERKVRAFLRNRHDAAAASTPSAKQQ